MSQTQTPTNPEPSEPSADRPTRYGIIISVLITSFIVIFVSLSSWLAASNVAERQDCLRPFTYEVDRSFGDLVIVFLESNKDAYPTAVASFKAAITARDNAVTSC